MSNPGISTFLVNFWRLYVLFVFFLERRVFSLIEKCALFVVCSESGLYRVYKSSGTPGFQPRPTGISLHLPLRLPNSQARAAKVFTAQQICTMVKFCRLFAPLSSTLGFMIIKSKCCAEVIDSTVIRGLD